MTASPAPTDPAGSGDHLDERGAAAPPHQVTAGGPPTGAQAAAIATALAELRRSDAATAAEMAEARQVPAWTRAGLAEGTRRVTLTRPQELPPTRHA